MAISLANIRSLKNHLVDLINGKRLSERDIICLTGIRLALLSNSQQVFQLPALVLYKNNSLPLINSCNWLQSLSSNKPVDISLGNFKINVSHENNRILHLLFAYNQFVTKSTHIRARY